MRYPEPQQLYPELPDPIRRGGGFIPQIRYFNFFDGVQEYVQLAQPVTLSGDYSISALVYKIPGQDVRVYGNSGGFTSRLLVNSDGSVNFRADNSGSQLGIDAPAGSIADNSLVSVEVTRAGSNGEIIVNGLSVSSGTVGTGDCVINQLARQSTSVSDGSIIANVRITDNGTLIHNWSIDDNSNVIADSVGSNNGTLVNPSGGWGLFDKQGDGDYLGQELVDFNSFETIDLDWAVLGAQSASVDTTNPVQGPALMTKNSALVVGSEYRCSFLSSSFTGNGRVGFANSSFTGSINDRSIGGDGTYSSDLTAAGSNLSIFRFVDSGNGQGDISSTTVKQLLRVA